MGPRHLQSCSPSTPFFNWGSGSSDPNPRVRVVRPVDPAVDMVVRLSGLRRRCPLAGRRDGGDTHPYYSGRHPPRWWCFGGGVLLCLPAATSPPPTSP
uniref:Uncharacterized protein n=1 Tax=Arundo donax TaxID=35708 RepID=A0A0A9EXR9_ARUDO